MEEMTQTQAYYLFLIGTADRSMRTVTGLSQRLGISKAAASVMVSKLERGGLLVRAGRELRLTASGRQAVADLREKQQTIYEWMRRGGLEESRDSHNLEEDALRYLLAMPPACIEATLAAAERQSLEDALYLSATSAFGALLDDGEYAVNFTIYRSDGCGVSMGNLGFYHPGKLAVLGGRGVLKLRAKRITYGVGPVKLRGSLSSLCYWDGGSFYTVERPGRGRDWRIPIPDCAVTQEQDQLQVSLPIKARASCGVARMPESEARLVFTIGKSTKNIFPLKVNRS